MAELLEDVFDLDGLEEASEDMHARYFEGITIDGVEVELKVVHDDEDNHGDVHGRPILSEDWQLLGNIAEVE